MYWRLRDPSGANRTSPPSVPPADDANVSVRTPVMSCGYGALSDRPTAGCVVVPSEIDVAGGGGWLIVMLMVLVPVTLLASVAVTPIEVVPPTAGVPLMTPVALFNCSP